MVEEGLEIILQPFIVIIFHILAKFLKGFTSITKSQI